jgi:hypothetical protein
MSRADSFEPMQSAAANAGDGFSDERIAEVSEGQKTVDSLAG